jgi:hypothetical protein
MQLTDFQLSGKRDSNAETAETFGLLAVSSMPVNCKNLIFAIHGTRDLL